MSVNTSNCACKNALFYSSHNAFISRMRPSCAFEHVHSFIFSSKTDISSIIRVGWIAFDASSNPLFIWKRYHRLVDILRAWFVAHKLPLEFFVPDPVTNLMPVRIAFFDAAVGTLKTMVENYSKSDITTCTLSELEYLSSLNCAAIETVALDDLTTQWVLQLLMENPSCVFGALFSNSMKTYKTISFQTCSDITVTFSSEDHVLDTYLNEYYRFLNYPQWPISYQMAMDLSRMAINRKRSKAERLAERNAEREAERIQELEGVKNLLRFGAKRRRLIPSSGMSFDK